MYDTDYGRISNTEPSETLALINNKIDLYNVEIPYNYFILP